MRTFHIHRPCTLQQAQESVIVLLKIVRSVVVILWEKIPAVDILQMHLDVKVSCRKFWTFYSLCSFTTLVSAITLPPTCFVLHSSSFKWIIGFRMCDMKNPSLNVPKFHISSHIPWFATHVFFGNLEMTQYDIHAQFFNERTLSSLTVSCQHKNHWRHCCSSDSVHWENGPHNPVQYSS